ncbi:efflux RND transporter periplasmic adaptor subunit [Herbaspirillum sp. LeCh32-8]|uniref:efflux RND transporter periplasmic adaptor subunit n=1 Tax=Herbaspirillum sp. LeCh32-8 TaxID=2821356 RepID=UPI001AE24DA2|nr:efflux RND transporter periplasmic adaptor subunit [Herbaspirillum sp. LeCh32-8]MBP0598090.1 efflux RND transporter periplasmic adaptor subunit [Herbaspirillum sp. LeCh32-8]
MTKKQKLAIAAIIVIAALVSGITLMKDAGSAGGAKSAAHQDEGGHKDNEHHGEDKGCEHKDAAAHGDGEHHGAAPSKGPHGGSMYKEGESAFEVLLSEDDGALMVYPYQAGKPVSPAAVKLSAVLIRPGKAGEPLELRIEKDAFKASAPVEEPHLFDIRFTASTPTASQEFTFSREEGKIELNKEQMAAAGIQVKTAGAMKLNSSLQLPGEIRFNEDRTAHVVPQVAGIVESVSANLGQKVKKGQVLAVINSSAVSEQRSELLNAQQRLTFAKAAYQREKDLWEQKISAQQDYLQAQTTMREAEVAVRNAQQKLRAIGATGSSGGLNRYEIRAPFDGVVVEKHLGLGEAVREDANAFLISDLTSVWAEIIVSPKDMQAVRVGEKVVVRAIAFNSSAGGKISYVGSLIGEQSRTAKAHVVLPNPDESWRPGLFVNVEVVSDEAQVPVAVAADALQSVDGKSVVFVRVPGGFAAQEVTIGRSNGKFVEIKSGLDAGAEYAAAGSFAIKAELGKGSAEHSH